MNPKPTSSWCVGQKVICTDDAFPRVASEWFNILPIAGHVYTIRAMQLGRYGVTKLTCLGFLLEEITNPKSAAGREGGFAESRFIPWLEGNSETAHGEKDEPIQSAHAIVKLKTLSVEQAALIPQVRDKWIKIGLDTAPIDRAKIRNILSRMYADVSRPAPRNIIHLDSPLQVTQVIAELRATGGNVSKQVSREVYQQVDKRVRSQANAFQKVNGLIERRVSEIVREQIETQVSHQVLERVHYQFLDQVLDQVRGYNHGMNLWEFMGRNHGKNPWEFLDGLSQIYHWLAWFDFMGRVGFDVSEFAPSFDMAKSCGWSVLFWDWAFISAKPEYIHRDEQGRLHCETGPAIRYPDGFSVFAIHGVRVPENVATGPNPTALIKKRRHN